MLTNSVSDTCYLWRCYHWPTMAPVRWPTMRCLSGQWKVCLRWADALRRLGLPPWDFGRHSGGSSTSCIVLESLRVVWLGNQDSNLG